MYRFWIVNYISFESNHKWFMVRTPEHWTDYDVLERAREGLSGGVGDDPAEIVSVESGYDDGTWTDYVPY